MMLFTFRFQEGNLNRFKTYLTSFEGGGLKQCHADKHAANVFYILKDTSENIDEAHDYASRLIKRKVDDIEWLPNTAKTYVNSLKLFIRFCQQMSTRGSFDYNVDKLIMFEKSTNMWLKTLFKKENKRMKNTTDIVNPNDIQSYLKSKRAQLAQQKIACGNCTTKADHTLVRNNLLMRVALSNCQRTGCITNMTTKDFKAAEIRINHYIVKVEDHKTSTTYGPAEVIMDRTLYHDVANYIAHFRPISACPYIFLTFNATQMDSGTVAAALTMELGHAGVEKR